MPLYYNNVLKAAWMSKEFGVGFTDSAKPFDVYVSRYGLGHPRSYDELSGFGGKIYIHSDSLHIFEPQGGDLVQFQWSELMYLTLAWVHELEGGFCRVVCGPEGPDDIMINAGECEIIQRNGKMFFMPEREVV